jgi:hypothetical protein
MKTRRKLFGMPAQVRLSRMDCIEMADCPNAKSCPPDRSGRITSRRRNAGSMRERRRELPRPAVPSPTKTRSEFDSDHRTVRAAMAQAADAVEADTIITDTIQSHAIFTVAVRDDAGTGGCHRDGGDKGGRRAGSWSSWNFPSGWFVRSAVGGASMTPGSSPGYGRNMSDIKLRGISRMQVKALMYSVARGGENTT